MGVTDGVADAMAAQLEELQRVAQMDGRPDPHLGRIFDYCIDDLLIFIRFRWGRALPLPAFDECSCRHLCETFEQVPHQWVRGGQCTAEFLVELLRVIVNAVRQTENGHFVRANCAQPFLFDVQTHLRQLNGENLLLLCPFADGVDAGREVFGWQQRQNE